MYYDTHYVIAIVIKFQLLMLIYACIREDNVRRMLEKKKEKKMK